DSDYPYSPKPAMVVPMSAPAPAANSHVWRFPWIWVGRVAIAASVVSGIVATAIGVIAVRALVQSAAIARLEGRGCYLTYAHEYPYQQDQLPEFLREWVGDR